MRLSPLANGRAISYKKNKYAISYKKNKYTKKTISPVLGDIFLCRYIILSPPPPSQ